MSRLEICFLTIGQIANLIKKKEVSPVEVTNLFLERIQSVDKQINAFITVMAEEAISASRRAEQEIARGKYRGPLHGVPVGLKDLYYTKGVRTTGGSKIKEWAEFVPEEDSTVTRKLKEAGAVIIGKLNMYEFAAGGGGTNQSPYYGSVRNPWDLTRMTGGSSSGSGAAVAASLCTAAMGSDTGGSVRVPASFCGIVGLKPTFGRVSSFGLIPLSWTMDHPGPMTKTAEDAAIIMNAISGYDPKDNSTADVPVPDFTESLGQDITGIKMGIPDAYFSDGLDNQVLEAVAQAINVLGELGAIIVEDISLPHIEYSAHLQKAITMVEAATYHEKLIKAHAEELAPNVRDRLELSLLVPTSYYIKSQRARSVVKEDFVQVMKKADVLITPTMAITAPLLGQETVTLPWRGEQGLDPLGRFTRPFNQAGLPACTVPCGFTSEELPIGLQIVGRAFDEATVLRVAHAYQQATQWHTKKPQI